MEQVPSWDVINNILVCSKTLAVLIEDSTVSLKIDGVVSELHPELSKQQIQEVAHHVYHKINMIPVYEQAKELINNYITEKGSEFK